MMCIVANRRVLTQGGLPLTSRGLQKMDRAWPLPHTGVFNFFVSLSTSRVLTTHWDQRFLCVLTCSVVSNSLWPPWMVAHSSVQGDSAGKNTGVGYHALLQGIFQPRDWTHYRWILYHLSHQRRSPGQGSKLLVFCFSISNFTIKLQYARQCETGVRKPQTSGVGARARVNPHVYGQWLSTYVNLVCFTLCVCAQLLQSCQTLCDPMDYSHQAPLSMEFSRQEYWSRLPSLSPGHLPYLRIKPMFPELQADSLPIEPPGKLCFTLYAALIYSQSSLL